MSVDFCFLYTGNMHFLSLSLVILHTCCLMNGAFSKHFLFQMVFVVIEQNYCIIFALYFLLQATFRCFLHPLKLSADSDIQIYDFISK